MHRSYPPLAFVSFRNPLADRRRKLAFNRGFRWSADLEPSVFVDTLAIREMVAGCQHRTRRLVCPVLHRPPGSDHREPATAATGGCWTARIDGGGDLPGRGDQRLQGPGEAALDEGRGVRETARLLNVSAAKVSEIRHMISAGTAPR